MPIAETDWGRATQVLAGAREVALACHIDPDGDALGSMLAMQRLLDQRGVATTAGWGEDEHGDGTVVVPPQYTFLPGLDRLTPAAGFPAAPDVMVAFDTGSADRLGSLRTVAEAAGTVIVLDHHASGEAFGDIRLIDGSAAATAVLVTQLIERMGGQLDREMATCLYVALVTDTGRFQYSSTTPAVMELGGRLIGFDIDHAAINRQVWDTHSFGYLKVLGRTLDRATLIPEAALAWTAVFQSDLDDLGIVLAETEGLIDVLRGVEAAEVTMVCKEQSRPASGGAAEASSWKVSLRSRGRVDVGNLAKALGGGGHTFAGGFTARGELREVVGRVVAHLAGAASLR